MFSTSKDTVEVTPVMAGVGSLFAGLERYAMPLPNSFKYMPPTDSGQCVSRRQRVNIEEPKKKQVAVKRKNTSVASVNNKKQKSSVKKQKKKKKKKSVYSKQFTPDIFQ